MKAIDDLLRVYTQQQLAEMLGVTQSTVSKWRRGVCTMRPKRARELERITKGRIKAADFLGL